MQARLGFLEIMTQQKGTGELSFNNFELFNLAMLGMMPTAKSRDF